MIHSKLVAVLEDDAIAYSTVTKYCRSASFSSISAISETAEPESSDDLIDQSILQALTEHPCLSVRRLARRLLLPHTTVYYHLTQKLQFVCKHLKWVPHLLSSTEKQNRVVKSIDLLRLLHSLADNKFQQIVTLDEPLFYLSTDHDPMWLPLDQNPDVRARQTVASPKVMVTIAWNPMAFHLIEGLPKGSKFNAGYYISAILEQLAQLPGPRGGERRGKLFVHADNARPHTARISLDFCDQNKLSVVSHPAYSPDLSPCDF
jgi:histone-lysine N-methyltransferase SETMAR